MPDAEPHNDARDALGEEGDVPGLAKAHEQHHTKSDQGEGEQERTSERHQNPRFTGSLALQAEACARKFT